LIALAAARLATNLPTSSSSIDKSIACRHAVMTLRPRSCGSEATVQVIMDHYGSHESITAWEDAERLQPFERNRSNPVGRHAGGDYCEGHQEHDGHAIHGEMITPKRETGSGLRTPGLTGAQDRCGHLRPFLRDAARHLASLAFKFVAKMVNVELQQPIERPAARSGARAHSVSLAPGDDLSQRLLIRHAGDLRRPSAHQIRRKDTQGRDHQEACGPNPGHGIRGEDRAR